MTDADKIAALEAQLEVARADLSSHVQALVFEVRRLTLRPGDVAVIEFPRHLSPAQAERIRSVWREKFPGTEALVLDGGAKLTIVEPFDGREVPQ